MSPEGNGLWRRLLARLIGEVKWTPPNWWQTSTGKARRGGEWVRSHRQKTMAILGLMIVLGVAGRAGWHWYQTRPRPVRLAVSCSSPSATPMEENAKPEPVRVTFTGSAAPLAAIGKPVLRGVTLRPAIAGQWLWESDHSLVFTPEHDWPVGQQVSVQLDPKLFPAHVLLARDEVEFKTAPFTATLTQASFYQDPRNPKDKQVAATITFSHAVDTATFAKHVKLVFGGLPGQTLQTPDDREVPSSFAFNKLKSEAYVRSDVLPIPEESMRMTVRLLPGARAAQGGPPAEGKGERYVEVPGMYSYFKVAGAAFELVRNAQFEPEQVVGLSVSDGVSEAELNSHVSAWVLPTVRPAEPGVPEHRKHLSWSVEEVSPKALSLGKPLTLDAQPTESDHESFHGFKVQAEVGRSVFVRVRQGIKSVGGYVLAKDFETVLRVPPFPSEVAILHKGSLLSLTGEKKLSVMTRDVETLRFEVSRVLPDEVAHLVTQTYGAMEGLSFPEPSRFGEDNVSERFELIRELGRASPGKAQYTAFDFAPYLRQGGPRQGLFFFHAQAWDPKHKRVKGPEDARFILVTNLGIVAKSNADGSRDVYVQSLATGEPVPGVSVKVLGKNGLASVQATTAADGHVAFPSLESFTRERAPVAYLAELKGDVAFLPFDRYDRALNLSRFDVGGVVTPAKPGHLEAFVFSDRGLYRPGDTFHVGMVVKQGDWARSLEGLPLWVSVTDPRGLEVLSQRLKVSASGLEEMSYRPLETSPTGTYAVNLYLVKGDRPTDLLGSTTVRVEEFLQDRMHITTHFSQERLQGWVSPDGLKGHVQLQNLFGIPAAGRRVVASMSITPALPSFRSLRDYSFSDPSTAEQPFNEQLAEATTDDKGEAEIALGLERFERATYRLSLQTEGFEAGGGRGVSAEASVLVSPRAYLIGTKPDGDLHYLSRGAVRKVNVVAVNPELKQVAVQPLKAQLIERRWVSTLVQLSDGRFEYRSVQKEIVLKTTPWSLPAQGAVFTVPTDQPGDFAWVLRDERDAVVSRVEFGVAGSANLTRSLDKNAELELTLAKSDCAAGDDLEMQIKAPYAGAGLITIERDRVYAHKWFKTSTTSTVQTLRMPPGLEGNAYVSVVFVRSLASPEIFTSPLSYAVAPVSISKAARVNDITLEVPDHARPGQPLHIGYRGSKPGKAVIFAVDEGILQVASYSTPDPVGYFFKKRALQVTTLQLSDLLLPEFSIVQSLSKSGGDASGALGKNLNPFKRKTEPPVAFWSGIVDIDTSSRDIVYDVPDSFAGTLRVMAVAISQEAVGSAAKKLLIRGPFVISPNAPTFVAPGDTFEVSAGVANGVEGSGKGARIGVTLEVGKGLEVVGSPSRSLQIDEGREGTVTFQLKARDVLGPSRLVFRSEGGGQTAHRTWELSVRPTSPYLVDTNAGIVREDRAKVDLPRKVYPDYRVQELSASSLPLALAHGFMTYLEHYSYPCTEQVASEAVPSLILRDRPDLARSPKDLQDRFPEVLRILRTRQNEEGAFGMWAANGQVSDPQTVYVLHFLTEAKERGELVPEEVLRRGLAYLTSVANRRVRTLGDARLAAYAQYVLTRNGTMTGSAVDALKTALEQGKDKGWKQDLTAAYLASTLKLLKHGRLAEGLIGDYAWNRTYGDLNDSLGNDAQYLYLLSRHFPERVKKIPSAAFDVMSQNASHGFSTLSAAYALLGFDAYATALGPRANAARAGLSVDATGPGGNKPLALPSGLFPKVSLEEGVSQVHVGNSGESPIFYQVTVAGFDRNPPTAPLTQGMEVQRELIGRDGKTTHELKLGEEVEVHVKVRSLDRLEHWNVALVDLLPGGFEVVRGADSEPPPEESVQEEVPPEEAPAEEASEDGSDTPEAEPAPKTQVAPARRAVAGAVMPQGAQKSSWRPDFLEVREDRVVAYGTVSPEVRELVYRVKATQRGVFTMPSAFAEGMYERHLRARAQEERVEVK